MFPSVSRSSAKFQLNSSISVFNICNVVKYFIITRGSALLVNNSYLDFEPFRKTAADVILRQRKNDYLLSVTWWKQSAVLAFVLIKTNSMYSTHMFFVIETILDTLSYNVFKKQPMCAKRKSLSITYQTSKNINESSDHQHQIRKII